MNLINEILEILKINDSGQSWRKYMTDIFVFDCDSSIAYKKRQSVRKRNELVFGKNMYATSIHHFFVTETRDNGITTMARKEGIELIIKL